MIFVLKTVIGFFGIGLIVIGYWAGYELMRKG